MNKPSHAGIGDNSVNDGQLRAFVERIERLEEEKKALADDIKDVYAEAKGNGFNVKVIRKVISIRKQDRDKRLEEQQLISIYMRALGMLGDLPLGQAALARAATEIIR